MPLYCIHFINKLFYLSRRPRFYRIGSKISRKMFYMFFKFYHKCFQIRGELFLCRLISFRKYKTIRSILLSQPCNKLKIYLLWLKTTVYQDKNLGQILSFCKIIYNHRLKLSTFIFGYSRISISRKINQIPRERI